MHDIMIYLYLIKYYNDKSRWSTSLVIINWTIIKINVLPRVSMGSK